MTLITDNTNLPPIRLAIKQEFCIYKHQELGLILHETRSKMARALAEKILSEHRFFSLEVGNMYGSARADCIVLTEQEYVDFAKEKFQQGMQHAQHFMPIY